MSLRSLAFSQLLKRAKKAARPRKQAQKQRGAWERDNFAARFRGFAALCVRAQIA